MYEVDGIKCDSLSELMDYLKAKNEGIIGAIKSFRTIEPSESSVPKKGTIFVPPRLVKYRGRNFRPRRIWTSEEDAAIVEYYSQIPLGTHSTHKMMKKLRTQFKRNTNDISTRKSKLVREGKLIQPTYNSWLNGKVEKSDGKVEKETPSLPRINLLTKDAEKVFYDALKQTMVDNSNLDFHFAQDTLQRKDDNPWSVERWLEFCEEVNKLFPQMAKFWGIDPRVIEVVMENGFHKIRIG
jgi:hypothetical protein